MTAIPTTILIEGMFARMPSLFLYSNLLLCQDQQCNRPAHNIRMGAPEMLMREMQYLFLISWFVNTASPTRLYCLVRQQSRACGATERQRAARLRLEIKPGKWCQEISCEAYASKIARVDAWARCVYAWACTRCVWRDIHLVTLQKCRTAGLMYIIMKLRNLITSVCKQCCYHCSTAHGERDFLLIIEFSLCVTDVAAIDYP